MSVSSQNLSELSSEQRRDLLAKLLAKRGASEPVLTPCSYGQRSLWFMHQLAPTSSVYNVSFAWRIRSAVDMEAMHRAFRDLVDRHEILRTTYEADGGEPMQRINALLPDGFRTNIVGSCSDDDLMKILVDAAAEPFDLEHGPLLRATMVTRTAQDHVMLVVIHHIACDLWSVEHILDDLRTLYEREVGGSHASPLPAPGASYRDFVSWQRTMLDGPEGAEHWNYWREKLSGTLPRLELPTDRPRPAVQSFAGGGVFFPIPADLITGLRAYATAQETTLFTVFLAAYQALLIRYSGQSSVLIGSVTSGRSRREFEPTVGYFVNPITFRADASDDPAFSEWLQRTRKDVLDALDHQDFPFPLLVERLKIDRDASRSPLTDAYFVWDKSRDRSGGTTPLDDGEPAKVAMEWQDLSMEQLVLTQIGTPSDVAMLIFETGPKIFVNIGYSTDLFDRSTIDRFGQHFIEMLSSVIADPDVAISRIPFTTAEERTALAARPAVAPDSSASRELLHRRFERQAGVRPSAIAATGASGQLTYAELNARANALAQRLRAAGVKRGDFVGLFVERDLGMAVAILGILKADAAYVPIDASYPEDRAMFMLNDAGASVLVSQRSLTDALPAIGAVTRVVLDDIAVDAEHAANVAADSTEDAGDRVAYVIYTSGSTGRPKGVMVTHRNVARLFDSTDHWYHFSNEDVWSLFHSVAFDVSVWEFWGALLSGARVVIIPFATTRSPDALLDLLAAEHVTILSQTPSAFRQLVAADAARADIKPLTLRLVIFGGEALDVNTLGPWFDRRGDQQPQLVNKYGITETTVHTTYRPIRVADFGQRVRSPIGIAIPDLYLLVLDPAGQPVPIGVPGELYVGGAGVARGYLNRPELNEARFLPDPASSDPNARLYRSGDLVRRLPDGDIEYLGRIDMQVKVRGFRVELGEIETALLAHPGVDQCAVVVKPDAKDESRLIGYVVARPGHDPVSADLRAFLRRTLPDYMVPSAFVRLAALPVTNSHKLDVRALPVPDQHESASTRAFVPPRSDVEQKIADELQRALSVERVGVDDDFFELGGHSILATALARWIQSHFQIDFPVYAVFESPTVAGMARRVSDLRNAGQPMTAAAETREEFDL
ncbi:MAG TPA: amino acid adenylation domain-containing protein [Gemmatimonadaceae bacterium]|jgi:amino acid adenylation domain-containing protein